MAKKDGLKHGVRFSSTNQPAKRGRKPSRLKKFIKEYDVSTADINDIFDNFLWGYSLGDITKIYSGMKDEKKRETLPVGIAILTAGLLEDIKRGDMRVFNMLIERVHGKPVQKDIIELTDISDNAKDRLNKIFSTEKSSINGND